MTAAGSPIYAPPSRLRTAAFAPVGEEGRAELVETRLARAISTGAFTEGERLPSEAEIAQLLGVAVVTVREALVGLRDRGLIETRRGRTGGSFVRPSRGTVEEENARALIALPRVALADLGVHYETIAGACAEYACLRAMPEELTVVERILEQARALPSEAWRRRITEVQLELAALSQSVRLTTEHMALQTEFTPLLALQDLDASTRETAHSLLVEQIGATKDGDAARARAAVRGSVRASMRWLVSLRAELMAGPGADDVRAVLEARRGRRPDESGLAGEESS